MARIHSIDSLTPSLEISLALQYVYYICHMCFRRYQQHGTSTGLFFIKIWLVESERTQRQQKRQPTSGFGLKTEGSKLPRMSSPALWSYSSYIVVRQILLLRPLRPQAALIRLGWRALSVPELQIPIFMHDLESGGIPFWSFQICSQQVSQD